MKLFKAAIPFFVGASALSLPSLSPRDDGVDTAGAVKQAADPDAIAKCHCPPARTVTKTVTVHGDGGHAPTSAPGSMQPWGPGLEKPERGGDKSKTQPIPVPTKKPEKPGSGHDKDKGKGGKNRNVVYFTNWGIYGKNFQPQDLSPNVKDITHLLYAFAKIGYDGTVTPSDSWSDVEKQWTDSSKPYAEKYDETQGNVHGCVRELFKYKEQNRQLKLLLSIGGWTYSNDERQFNHVTDEAGRQKFAQSAVQLVSDWGFDGIDIDWEYPQDATEARNYVLLLKACREALDAYAARHANGYHFLLTVAAPAGPTRYQVMDLEGMDPYIDQWNLMAYDYAGSWDMTTGHGSALFVDPSNMEATKFSTEKAVDDYIARGIDPSKIVMGMPLYGRAFENADGMGKSYSGIPSGEGIYEGTYLYKDLPRPNAQVLMDEVAMAAYSYDPRSKELITYDTVQTTQAKTRWMMQKGLGGMMFWEAAGDKTGDDSLIRTTSRTMGGLDTSQNLLSYPNSKYLNIKNSKLS